MHLSMFLADLIQLQLRFLYSRGTPCQSKIFGRLSAYKVPKAVKKGDGFETMSLSLLCVLDSVSVLGVAIVGIVSSRASPAEPK